MNPILFADADAVERAERTYLVPRSSLSDFLRVVHAGFCHPRYKHLSSWWFTWEPADEMRDRVTVTFLPDSADL